MTEPERRPIRVDADAKDIGRGLAGLVVAVLDLIRQLLERQALRRVDAGTLTDDEIERLGQALLDLEGSFAELRDKLGLSGVEPAISADLSDAVNRATGLGRDCPDDSEMR